MPFYREGRKGVYLLAYRATTTTLPPLRSPVVGLCLICADEEEKTKKIQEQEKEKEGKAVCTSGPLRSPLPEQPPSPKKRPGVANYSTPNVQLNNCF